MRRQLFSLFLYSFFLNACARPVPPVVTPPAPEPPAAVAFDLVACRTTPVDNYCDGMEGATFAIHLSTGPDVYRTVEGDGNGYVFVQDIPATLHNTDITITAPGFRPRIIDTTVEALLATNATGAHNFFQLQTTDLDPMQYSLDQLAAIRGSMWPLGTAASCGAMPYGPRPYAADNVLATDFISTYSREQQQCIISELKARGYTHVVVGPFVDSDGYRGLWLPMDWRGANWEKFLDVHQMFYNAGLIPVTFGRPDGWSLERFKAEFTSLLMQPRAQRLIRIIVPMGWEPERYADSSCTWAEAGRWARDTLPSALVLVHMTADQDAPGGGDARCNDDDHSWNPDGNAGVWRRVAPYYHGVLFQFMAFENPTATGCDREHPEWTSLQCFANSFNPDHRGSYRDRFEHGYAGWPRNSAWGDRPLYSYAGEYKAYWTFWHHRTEAEGVAWGDAAMAAGAYGCLDGCSPRR